MNNPITLMERVADLERRVAELEQKLGMHAFEIIPPPTLPPAAPWPPTFPPISTPEFSEPAITVVA